MGQSFFDVQRRQRQQTVLWLGVEAVLLIAVGYVVTLPWQFWQSCSIPDTDECVPLDFEWGLAFKIAVAVAVYLAIAVLVARHQASPRHGRPPSSAPHERRLPTIAETMSIAAGIPVPRVTVIDDPSLNAYATTDEGRGVIVVTSGLLRSLDDRAITGVVAHEMAHLKNRDVQVKWIAAFGVGLVFVLAAAATLVAMSGAQAADDVRRRNNENDGGSAGIALVAGVFAAFLWLVALPAAVIVRAAISRRREQLADAIAVQFTRDPTGLRVALERIAASGHQPRNVRLATAALWIDNPMMGSRWPRFVQRILDTHPRLETRIAWLRLLEGANELWRDFD